MKVSELTGALLDYWVARVEMEAEGGRLKDCGIRALDRSRWVIFDPRDNGAMAIICVGFFTFRKTQNEIGADRFVEHYSPSTRWAEGGLIVDRARMNFATIGTGPRDEDGNEPIVAIPIEGRRAAQGPTHLIAAMRAIVLNHFGEEVLDEGL
ncbi:hypothetical protein AWB80_08161 [Caballeronia pedi]|uniref:DUF2591 domain-containing protein n=1 Tax=Caballeronia pedi TaxID=1777141 RepID=A0A158E463_9BURK|nr:phage protein NinX family protein [Caballeronia pedi]SAL01594.1 hypothetical protein AWB80_08161 [Caballeronia pedi]